MVVSVTNNNTPVLRFDGFDGEWETRKLNDLVEVGNGRDYKHLNEGRIPVYGTGGYMLSVDQALSYSKDAIGIGRKGTIDKPFLLRAPFWTVDTLFFVMAKSGIDLAFLFSEFQRIDWKSKNTATGVPSITSQAIEQTLVTISSSLEEQRAIGDLFYELDTLIEQRRAKHANLQRTKAALLQRMFPRDGTDEPELRLDGFSGVWETISFDSLLTRVEIGTSVLGSNRYHGVPLLKMGNIQRGFFDFSSFERLPESAEVPSNSLVRTGDFLFNTRNTMELVGKGATWMGESGAFAFNGNIARFTLERVDTKFFNYLYNHPRSIRDVNKCATGTTSVAAIYPSSLKSVQFQIPTIEEQRAIGEMFADLDALIAAEHRYITQLTQAKTALLQRMFV